MVAEQVERIRKRTLYSLSPLAAQHAQVSLEQLRQFTAGAELDDAALGGLARYFGMQEAVS